MMDELTSRPDKQRQDHAIGPATVIRFWFETLEPKEWFRPSAATDNVIRDRFGATLEQAARCELAYWRSDAAGRLAEILVLDQFSRNIYRRTPAAYTNDPLALALAQEAVSGGLDRTLTAPQQAFLYMPYMHSESLHIHAEALRLFAQPGLEKHYESECQHYAILQQFGRYPHRNRLLGRPSTPEEEAFLEQPGSSF